MFFAWQICSNITHFKQQQEILPAHLNFFETGLKKVLFHRRLRSNITHLAHHLENLPIPLISFAKKHSSPKGDSGLLLCGRWRRPKKQQVRIFSDPLDFSVFLQNTSTIRPCERSESARKSSEGTFSRGAPNLLYALPLHFLLFPLESLPWSGRASKHCFFLPVTFFFHFGPLFFFRFIFFLAARFDFVLPHTI